jgi:hypothetical protein
MPVGIAMLRGVHPPAIPQNILALEHGVIGRLQRQCGALGWGLQGYSTSLQRHTARNDANTTPRTTYVPRRGIPPICEK